MLLGIYLIAKKRVSNGIFADKIYLTAKKSLQIKLKIKEIIRILTERYSLLVKSHKQVNIAVSTETWCKDRAKNIKRLHLVLSTKLSNPIHIAIYQFHKHRFLNQ